MCRKLLSARNLMGLMLVLTSVTYAQNSLQIIDASAPRGGDATVEIRGSLDGIYGANLAIVVDTAAISGYALGTNAFSSGEINLSNDTLFVGLASGSPVTLVDATVAQIILSLKSNATVGTSSLGWVGFPDTHADEQSVALIDGQLEVVNQAPYWTISPPATVVVDEVALLSFTITAVDDDAVDGLTYSDVTLPPGAAFNAGTQTFSWTPTYEEVTTAEGSVIRQATFEVTDGYDVLSGTADITVTNVNRAPYWDIETVDQSGVEDVMVSFTINATDDDGDPVTYTDTSIPIGSSFDGPTATFTWIPDLQDAGPHVATFEASDASSTISQDVNIDVLDDPRTPVWNITSPQSVNENTDLEFIVSATDEDNETLPLTYTATGVPVGASFDEPSATFSWTPDFLYVTPAEVSKTAQVTFTVVDGAHSVDQVVDITVDHVNQVPYWDPALADQSVAEGDLLQFTTAASDDDSEVITYSVTGRPIDATFDTGTGEFSWDIDYASEAEYDLVFHASDGNVTIDDPVHISVAGTSLEPYWDLPASDAAGNEGDLLEITVNATDDDAEPNTTLTYDVTAGMPPGASFDAGSATLSWTPGSDAVTAAEGVKIFTVTFSATDGLFTILDDVAISITNVNLEPVWDPASPASGLETDEISFVVSASDPDSDPDPITYSEAGLPGDANFNSATATFTWTPGYDAVTAAEGEKIFQATLVASDGLASVELIVDITITHVNRAPSFAPAQNDTIAEPATLMSFTVPTDDPDGDDVTVTTVAIPAWASFDGTTFSGTPDYINAGDTLVVFDATDGIEVVQHTVNINVPDHFGDVSEEGGLSSFDAALILQYSVHLPVTPFNVIIADVTGVSGVTAYDAALVLRKVVEPGYVFPVFGGTPTKPAVSTPRSLAFYDTDAGWELRVNDPTGIIAGDLVVELPDESAATVSGANVAYRQDGRMLAISFARLVESDSNLLTIASSGISAPLLSSVMLNEGSIPVGSVLPTEFALHQNTPNPFNPQTSIRFDLPSSGYANLTIYNMSGQIVRTLVNGSVGAGSHELVWDARDNSSRRVASGVYIYRVNYRSDEGASSVTVRRMTLLR
jgi:hypothetical protein